MMKKTLFVLIAMAFIFNTAGLASTAVDPLRIAMGARALGLGRAQLGYSGDINCVYTNPAGIGTIDRWQMTSMSAKLFDEYSYLNIGGVSPIRDAGNFGIGLVRVSVGGAIPTRIAEGSDPTEPVYDRNWQSTDISYNNSIFLLSYGSKLEKLSNLPGINNLFSRAPWLNDVNWGANLKLFNVGLTGGGLADANGSGMEMDVGFQSKTGLKWLEVGGAIQNLLPADLGGKMTYPATGWEESFPAVLKLGAAANILGGPEAMKSFRNQRLTMLLDLDIEPKRSDVPPLFKVGFEWYPINILALRAGINQAMSGTETANNLTAGVGLYFRGFRFDYAYHAFEGAPGSSNNFFSLTYGVYPPETEKIKYITIIEPFNATLITTAPEVTIVGKMHPDVGSAKLGDNTWLSINEAGSFEVVAALPEIGKETIWIYAYDRKGKLLETERVRVLRLITYPDVGSAYWTYDQINHIGTLDIIKGYPDGTFRPEGNITRAEMSTLLSRTQAGFIVSGEVEATTMTEEATAEAIAPEITVTRITGEASIGETSLMFFDVPLNHWANKYITYTANNGIVKGYPDGTFRPSNNITRAEGLTMIARFGKVSEEGYVPYFVDVPETHWAAKTVTGAYKEGILDFLKRKPFLPNRRLNRAESVEMLFRTRLVKAVVADLRNFEVGYETEPPYVEEEISFEKGGLTSPATEEVAPFELPAEGEAPAPFELPSEGSPFETY